MSMKFIKLRIRVIVEPDDEGFHAYCPDLKGLHVHGDTEHGAVENAKSAVELYMMSILKHQEPIPIGVLDASVTFSLADCLKTIRTFFSGAKKHSYIEDITLPACA